MKGANCRYGCLSPVPEDNTDQHRHILTLNSRWLPRVFDLAKANLFLVVWVLHKVTHSPSYHIGLSPTVIVTQVGDQRKLTTAKILSWQHPSLGAAAARCSRRCCAHHPQGKPLHVLEQRDRSSERSTSTTRTRRCLDAHSYVARSMSSIGSLQQLSFFCTLFFFLALL